MPACQKALLLAAPWIVLTGLMLVPAARGSIVTQYSFENDLLDTAPAGGTADHLTGSAASGTLAVSYAPGVVGQAVRVSRDPGQAAVLQAADSGDLDLAAAWTVEGFVRPDSANAGEWDRFATKWFDTTGEWHWAFRYGNNGQDLFLNNGQVINAAGTGTVPLNQWTHVAMTGDPTDPAAGIKLWQNGHIVGTAPYQAVVARTNPFRIGNRGATVDAGLQFSGLVDEFMIHDAAADGAYMLARTALLANTQPRAGLLNFYRFEGDGNDQARQYVANSGSNDDNLSLVGNASYVPGMVGQAVDLDGGYFTAPNTAVDDLDLPSTFTIEAWINPDNVAKDWNRFVLNWDGGGQNSYHFGLRGNDVNLFLSQDGAGQVEVATGGDVVAGAWQHIAATSDGSTVLLYLDGVQVASGVLPAGAPFVTTTAGLGIGDSAGAPSSGYRFLGLVDELAMWNVALSPGEIAAHYARGAAGYGLAVPEPSAFMLAALGLLGLGGLGWRSRRRR